MNIIIMINMSIAPSILIIVFKMAAANIMMLKTIQKLSEENTGHHVV